MNSLGQHCVTKALHTRLLTALWSEVGAEGDKPPVGWNPNPEDVAHLKIDRIWGIGKGGVNAINSWLISNGYRPQVQRKKHTARRNSAALAAEIDQLKTRVLELERLIVSQNHASTNHTGG